MKKVVNVTSDFEALLLHLGPKAKNVCLLGSSWTEKLAWNPVKCLIINNAEAFNEVKLHQFILDAQNKKHLVTGFLSYELGHILHGLPRNKKQGSKLPLAVFLAYDNYLEKAGNKIYAHFERDDFLEELKKLDKSSPSKPGQQPQLSYKTLWDKESYNKAFSKIKNYIYDGVIYQINLTQEMQASYSGDPRTLFAELSAGNTAKMKTYFEAEDFELLSFSPERFVRTQSRTIETTPIKGTRPRGENKIQDKKNEQDLLDDDKEKAELNMITDLLRNDLGKVCAVGSVKLKSQRQIERLTSVIHTFSHIEGRLKPEITPFTALLSMFPGGSITGCPKRKAMEIIDELEMSARGAYCGSMVTIDRYGNLDSNILIRTVIKSGERLSLSTGSGIVYDSAREKEYQETLDKVRPIIQA